MTKYEGLTKITQRFIEARRARILETPTVTAEEVMASALQRTAPFGKPARPKITIRRVR